MLVVRPPPTETESLMGYVLRLTEVNGYPTSTYILGEMRTRKYQGSIERFDADALMRIAGITASQAQRLSMRCSERDNRATIGLCGQPVATYATSINHPKVCPLCLARFGRCEAFWELSLAVACPLHKIALVDICQGCGLRLHWRRSKIWQCSCGADLRKQVPTRIFPRETVDLLATLRGLLYQDESTATHSGFDLVYGLGFKRAIRLLGSLCKQLGQNQPSSGKTRALRAYVGNVDEVANMLYAWPQNFRVFLADHYGRAADLPITPTFRTLFGKLILIGDQAGGDFARAITEEIQTFAAAYWPKSAIARPGKPLLIDDNIFRWGRMADLMEISGMHRATVRRHLKDKKVRTKYVVTSRGGRTRFYGLDWARDIASMRSPSVRGRVAAKQLGMTVRVLQCLREMNVYTSKSCGYGQRSYYNAADLADLENRLLGVATRARSLTNRRIKLGDVLRSSRHSPGRKAAFVASIINREIRVWTSGERSVSDLMVSHHIATKFFSD